MKNIRKVNKLIWVMTVLFILGLAGCSDDKPYSDYFTYSPIEYIGKVDSVSYLSGVNKVRLTWKVSTDPSVKSLEISWLEDGGDKEMSVDVDENQIGEYMNVEITDLSAGSYTFFLVSSDGKGNSSVPVELFASVLDPSYLDLIQPVLASGEYVDNSLIITLSNEEEGYIGSEVFYTNTNNEEVSVLVDEENAEFIIEDYKLGTGVTYLSNFNDPEVLGTLSSKETNLQVRLEFSKEEWIASADYDEPSNRGSWNVIDANPSTVWHMSKLMQYPHPLDIDMGTVQTVSGLTFLQRQDNINYGLVKLVEIQTGSDDVNWISQKEVELPFTQDPISIPLEASVEARYLRIIFKSDYKGGDFTAISEVGAYAIY
ncbi:discoidin domain-containing protein [Zhouia spongiae]|uniref:Discoidin domain-containing protein n=1 Tax=Zhouia spongiae TaxID=2202721 RepID=A0ABY3YHX1_9FLAO|nr:DUF4998 domain-containing protein [Zhouia spongiae]UNY97486.1 discoidin domain-containing protein [Zhouia spongiae]